MHYLRGLSQIALGIFVLLLGFRVIPTKNFEICSGKFGVIVKILGLIIVLVGLIELFGFFR